MNEPDLAAAAIKTLRRLGWVYTGGDEWMPKAQPHFMPLWHSTYTVWQPVPGCACLPGHSCGNVACPGRIFATCSIGARP